MARKQQIRNEEDAVLVLSLLNEQTMYGNQIIQMLRTQKIDMFERREGNIYPILHALKKEKYLTSEILPNKKGRLRSYYEITMKGRSLLNRTQYRSDMQPFGNKQSVSMDSQRNDNDIELHTNKLPPDYEQSVYSWCKETVSYIKFKKDRGPIYDELCYHLIDKIDELVAHGMEREAAMSNAIEEMGDLSIIGRKFGELYLPYSGYFLRVSRWMLIGSILFLVYVEKNYGSVSETYRYYYRQPESSIDLYYEAADEDPKIKRLSILPQTSKAGPYEISLTRALLYQINENNKELCFTFHSEYGILRLPPKFLGLYMTAVDSNGYEYPASVRAYQNAVCGSRENEKLGSCDYDMCVHGIVGEPEWIDIKYEKNGVSIKFRITLEDRRYL